MLSLLNNIFHIHAHRAFLSQLLSLMQMLDIINMPTHSFAPPPPPVSLWSTNRGSDLVGAACINKGMTITMLFGVGVGGGAGF